MVLSSLPPIRRLFVLLLFLLVVSFALFTSFFHTSTRSSTSLISSYLLEAGASGTTPRGYPPFSSSSSSSISPAPFPAAAEGLPTEDLELYELKKKVKVIVTTVAQNRARVELLQRVYRDDPWARGLFVFISDAADPDLGTITVPKCNALRSWVSAKCCRFAHFYFSVWEEQYPEVEWVFKADDDSYVHPRNLLLTVASLISAGSSNGSDAASNSADKPLFLGDRTSWYNGRRDDDPASSDLRSITIWPHGGAGWLINRAARDHLKSKPSLRCSGLDDVGFGQWATRNGLALTPYHGFHQRSAFDGRLYGEGKDFFKSIVPAAFFLCVKDDIIRLPYYPVTFHKLMATFPQMHEIMNKKRFELVPLPELRAEDKHLEGRGDNYYRRVRPWLEALAANKTAYAHADCRSFFDLDTILSLKHHLQLP